MAACSVAISTLVSVVIMMAIGSAARRLFESEDGDAVVIWTGMGLYRRIARRLAIL